MFLQRLNKHYVIWSALISMDKTYICVANGICDYRQRKCKQCNTRRL